MIVICHLHSCANPRYALSPTGSKWPVGHSVVTSTCAEWDRLHANHDLFYDTDFDWAHAVLYTTIRFMLEKANCKIHKLRLLHAGDQ